MIGNTLSHHRIIEKLGQGGNAEVYRAQDTSPQHCARISRAGSLWGKFAKI
jgi:serine/threonine protein kinase